ncbi:MAG: cysteine methyltransferase, partial [Flavobacteriales bacterium]|nr:cysteine methyltransferase [Flavobacteriales bacterium]
MSVIHTHTFKSPYGELILGSWNNQLCLCDWRYRKIRHAVDERIKKHLHADFVEEETEVINATMQQLSE